MPVDLFLNSAAWKRIGCTEQEVKFLQGLLDRSGGATGSTSSDALATLTNQIIIINEAITAIESAISGIESASGVSVEHRLNTLQSSIKRIFAHVNLLESAPDYSWAHKIKKLEHRINQLEAAQ